MATVLLKCGHAITIEGSLKMGDFRRWMAAEKEGDLAGIYKFLAKLVKTWDWPGLDPQNPDSYDELDMHEYQQINKAILAYITDEAASKN